MEPITLTKKFAVYVDKTLDTGTIFYCGKGNQGRVNKLTRNKKRNAIAASHGCIRIVVFETDEEQEAFDKEREVIADAQLNCYKHPDNHFACNFTDGGEGASGSKRSDKTKLKLRESHLGKNHTDETKRKCREASTGKKHSNEAKLKIGEGNLGKKRSDETKLKLREANLGKIVSDEVKRKLRESHLGKKNGPHSDETKLKIGEGNLGKKRSDEVKRKLREVNLGKKHTDEVKLKISIANHMRYLKKRVESAYDWWDETKFVAEGIPKPDSID